MNSSNATTSTRCPFLQANAHLVESVTFTAYYILMPLRFFIGVPSQSLALAAFRKQAKAESSYAYPIFVSAGKTFEICEFTLCVSLKFFFAGLNGVAPGVEWYMKSYPLMVIAVNIIVTTQAAVVTLSLALSTAMAVDRAFAMVKPFVYRSLNKKRHQKIALLICIFLAISSSLDFGIRYTLVIDGRGYYAATPNPYYARAPWTSVLNYSRTALRFIMTAVLITSNALSLKLYKKRMRQLKQLSVGKMEDQKQQVRRRKNEKTLFAVTIFQAPFIIFNMIFFSFNSLGVFFKPTFSSCEGSLVLALSDIGMELTDMLEFYVIFCVSKEFRRMVMSVTPFCKRYVTTTTVTPIRSYPTRPGLLRG